MCPWALWFLLTLICGVKGATGSSRFSHSLKNIIHHLEEDISLDIVIVYEIHQVVGVLEVLYHLPGLWTTHSRPKVRGGETLWPVRYKNRLIILCCSSIHKLCTCQHKSNCMPNMLPAIYCNSYRSNCGLLPRILLGIYLLIDVYLVMAQYSLHPMSKLFFFFMIYEF